MIVNPPDAQVEKIMGQSRITIQFLLNDLPIGYIILELEEAEELESQLANVLWVSGGGY
jgi:hypothetical protein